MGAVVLHRFAELLEEFGHDTKIFLTNIGRKADYNYEKTYDIGGKQICITSNKSRT